METPDRSLRCPNRLRAGRERSERPPVDISSPGPTPTQGIRRDSAGFGTGTQPASRSQPNPSVRSFRSSGVASSPSRFSWRVSAASIPSRSGSARVAVGRDLAVVGRPGGDEGPPAPVGSRSRIASRSLTSPQMPRTPRAIRRSCRTLPQPVRRVLPWCSSNARPIPSSSVPSPDRQARRGVRARRRDVLQFVLEQVPNRVDRELHPSVGLRGTGDRCVPGRPRRSFSREWTNHPSIRSADRTPVSGPGAERAMSGVWPRRHGERANGPAATVRLATVAARRVNDVSTT